MKKTGKTGVVEFQGGQRTPRLVSFPTDKVEIERKIITQFKSEISRVPHFFPPIQEVRQNPSEYDLDCTIELCDGTTHLMDLLEFAPLQLFKDYEKVPLEFNVGQLADLLLFEIRKKAEKYRGLRSPWLLCYATDAKLAIGPEVIAVLEAELRAQRGSLERVYFMGVLEEAAGAISPIYPKYGPLEFVNIEIKRRMIQKTIDLESDRRFGSDGLTMGLATITYLP